jgi:hypothetical protein
MDLIQSLAHSLEIRHLRKLGQPMWYCVAAALFRITRVARRDGPNGGGGGRGRGVIFSRMVIEVWESMFKTGPDVFVNLPFVHICVQLISWACAEDECASSLTCKNVAPVFICMSTAAAFFMLTSVMFVMGVRAPKTVIVFGRENLMSGC